MIVDESQAPLSVVLFKVNFKVIDSKFLAIDFKKMTTRKKHVQGGNTLWFADEVWQRY